MARIASMMVNFLSVILSLCILAHPSLGLDNNDTEYIEIGGHLFPITCNKDNMYMFWKNGIRLCQCKTNYYLDIGNKYDIDTTASCAHCTNCSYLPGRSYTALECGTFSDTHCCAKPFEAALMGKQGHLDCLDLEARLAEISGCGKSYMSRKTRKDGEPICSCPVGFYLHMGSPFALDTSRCKRCTDCKSNTHTAKDCGKYQDTVCCASSNMTAIATKYGHSKCRHPDPAVPTLAGISTEYSKISDRAELKGCNGSTMRIVKYENGTETCICGDDSLALRLNDGFECKAVAMTGKAEYLIHEPGHQPARKYPINIFMGLLISTMILVVLPVLYCKFRGGWGSSRRNNLGDIESLASRTSSEISL